MANELQLKALRCLNAGCDRVPPCEDGHCEIARKSFAPATLQEPSASDRSMVSRSLLIGGLVNKWSGNDEVKASDFLEWIMSQPIIARPTPNDPDSWEANAQHMLDRCPHTVWQRPGGGAVDLKSTLIVTFMGMQQELAKRATQPKPSQAEMLEAARAAQAAGVSWRVGSESMAQPSAQGEKANPSPLMRRCGLHEDSPSLRSAAPASAQGEAVAPFLFVAMDDDKRAHLTWCADEAAVREAVKGDMFFVPAGKELSPEHTEQLDGSVEELLDSGALIFEGDAPLYLYRIAAAQAAPAQPSAQGEAVASEVRHCAEAAGQLAFKHCKADRLEYKISAAIQAAVTSVLNDPLASAPAAQPSAQGEAVATEDEAWAFADKVWVEMDRKSMPGIYMQMVTQAVAKHYPKRASAPAAPALAVQSTVMNQAADLLAQSMMLADADRVRAGALVVEAHNMLVGTHAVEQPKAADADGNLARLLALHKKACDCEAAWWVFRGNGESEQGRRLAEEAKAAESAFVEKLTEAIGCSTAPLSDGQCDSILNHLAFRFLLDVNDEKRPRMRQAVRDAVIEARNEP